MTQIAYGNVRPEDLQQCTVESIEESNGLIYFEGAANTRLTKTPQKKSFLQLLSRTNKHDWLYINLEDVTNSDMNIWVKD